MAINIKGTNMELTEALRNYVTEKLQHLERHATHEPTNIDVELEHQPHHQSGPVFRCEIMYTIPGDKQIERAESTETDMYAAIDTCIPKIKEQLNRESDRRTALVKSGGRKLKEMVRRWFERGE